jgi:four helix bundle protein
MKSDRSESKGKEGLSNWEFGKRLEKRTKDFAIKIIKLSSRLPSTPEASVIRYQITKAGSSVGANYREANRGRSKADFQNKIAICLTKTGEAQYWLEIIYELEWLPAEDLKDAADECNELISIFSSIRKKK